MSAQSIRIVSLVYLFLFGLFSSYAQTEIPMPTDKSEKYQEHADYYKDYWVGYIKQHEYQLQQTQDYEKLSQIFYNRFITYYKMLTDTPSDVLLVFLDAFSHNKHYTCYYYRKNIMKKFTWAREYYNETTRTIDKLCNCLYDSYNQTVITELKSMKQRDQKYRQEDALYNLNIEAQKKMDSLNFSHLKEIIEQYGYPDMSLVGYEYHSYGINTLLHSGISNIEYLLPHVEKSLEENLILKRNWPTLIDRYRVLNGQKQMFGTQRSYNEESNKFELSTLEYGIEETNRLRKEYGLRELNI